jgi:hypothetical protein
LQTSIVTQLHAIRSLSFFVAFVHPDHNSHSVLHFVDNLSQTGLVTSSTRMEFTNYCDTIVGHTTIIVGIHNSTKSSVEEFQFKTPPSKLPSCLNYFLWQNLNKVEYRISYGHEDDDFGKKPCTGFTSSLLSNTISISIPDGIKPLYFLHAVGSDTSILAGAMVVSWDSLCPPFTSVPNCNIFQSHFGVKFLVNDKQYMCQFSPFEYTFCYGFMDSLRYIFCTGIIGMPLMPASQPCHHYGSLIHSMIAFAKSLAQTLRSSNPINSPHLQHISKLLPMGPLAQGCPTTPNGFTH